MHVGIGTIGSGKSSLVVTGQIFSEPNALRTLSGIDPQLRITKGSTQSTNFGNTLRNDSILKCFNVAIVDLKHLPKSGSDT